MNKLVIFALLAICSLLSLDIAAADCINLYVKENIRDSKGNVISTKDVVGAWVNIDGIRYAGTTGANGYLQIPGSLIIPTPPYYYHKINVIYPKFGQADVTVMPGTCPSATMYIG
jgi:hypothetical protein